MTQLLTSTNEIQKRTNLCSVIEVAFFQISGRIKMLIRNRCSAAERSEREFQVVGYIGRTSTLNRACGIVMSRLQNESKGEIAIALLALVS